MFRLTVYVVCVFGVLVTVDKDVYVSVFVCVRHGIKVRHKCVCVYLCLHACVFMPYRHLNALMNRKNKNTQMCARLQTHKLIFIESVAFLEIQHSPS